MAQRIKLLITVKTYPLPSTKYEEIVCTAGVLEDGTFIRLYPLDYRSKSYEQWFKKYQWVEVDVEKNKKDPRPESFRPLSDIKPIGDVIRTNKNWAERRRYVLTKPMKTMCQLENTPQSEVSLGIIKPRIIEDFLIEKTEKDWKPKTVALINQMKLFGPDKKPIEKIPYKFSYIFKCQEPKCGGHTKMIEDWEVGQLFRKMRDDFNNEKIACEKVKQRFFDTICAPDKDTHFFVGTVLGHSAWIILGTFWPRKE